MNLIEQLGGYEFVKGVRSKKTSNKYLSFNGRELSFLKVDAELLQYRRENNIFEVGDSIMYEGKYYEIKYIYHSEKARITDGFQGKNIYDFPKGIRHATPEEIRAAKRLK